jgi:hypothetical protein
MLVQNYAPIAIRMNTYGSIVQRPEPTYQRFYAAPTDCNEIAKFNDRESPRSNRQLLTGPEQGAEQRDRGRIARQMGEPKPIRAVGLIGPSRFGLKSAPFI